MASRGSKKKKNKVTLTLEQYFQKAIEEEMFKVVSDSVQNMSTTTSTQNINSDYQFSSSLCKIKRNYSILFSNNF